MNILFQKDQGTADALYHIYEFLSIKDLYTTVRLCSQSHAATIAQNMYKLHHVIYGFWKTLDQEALQVKAKQTQVHDWLFKLQFPPVKFLLSLSRKAIQEMVAQHSMASRLLQKRTRDPLALGLGKGLGSKLQPLRKSSIANNNVQQQNKYQMFMQNNSLNIIHQKASAAEADAERILELEPKQTNDFFTNSVKIERRVIKSKNEPLGFSLNRLLKNLRLFHTAVQFTFPNTESSEKHPQLNMTYKQYMQNNNYIASTVQLMHMFPWDIEKAFNTKIFELQREAATANLYFVALSNNEYAPHMSAGTALPVLYSKGQHLAQQQQQKSEENFVAKLCNYYYAEHEQISIQSACHKYLEQANSSNREVVMGAFTISHNLGYSKFNPQTVMRLATCFADDIEVMCTLVEYGGQPVACSLASVQVQRDPRFIELVLKYYPDQLSSLPPYLLLPENSSSLKQVLKQNSNLFKLLPYKLRCDPTFVNLVVSKDPSLLGFTCPAIHDNDQILHKAVERDGNALMYASERLSKDMSLCFKALKNNSRAIRYVHRDLFDNYAFMVQFLESKVMPPPYVYSRASEALKANIDFCKICMELEPQVIGEAPHSIRDCKEIMSLVLKKQGSLFVHCSQRLKQDLDVIVIALKQINNSGAGAKKSYITGGTAARSLRDEKRKFLDTIYAMQKQDDQQQISLGHVEVRSGVENLYGMVSEELLEEARQIIQDEEERMQLIQPKEQDKKNKGILVQSLAFGASDGNDNEKKSKYVFKLGAEDEEEIEEEDLEEEIDTMHNRYLSRRKF